MAGSTKFAFRSREDPRFTDRRMQNLLRRIDDSFDKYNSESVSSICKTSCINANRSVLHHQAQVS